MKKLRVTMGIGLALAVAAPVLAHQTGIAYATRGECESAYAGYSKFDRERLHELFGFTRGEAQQTFRDLFRCQYDDEEGAWFIVRIAPF